MAKTILEGMSREIQWADSRYFSETTVPQNNSTVSTVVNSGAGSKFGQDKIVTKVTTDVVIADTTTIVLKYEDSADGSTGWGELGTYTITASGSTTISAGDNLAPDFTIPDQAAAYTRVTITTTDVAAVGAIDCYNSREPQQMV